MSCCARCGQGICSTAGKIALNKVWHKGCFCCYSCNRPLNVDTARIYYGEVFCTCCCPQEIYPLKICRINSTPSFNCPSPVMPCCNTTDSDCCPPRDAHSCSCIPACCAPKTCPCACQDTCFKRIHCNPRPPKPTNFPPRQRFCNKCCSRSPKRRSCQQESCCVKRRPPCCEGQKRLIYIRPCEPKPCKPCKPCSPKKGPCGICYCGVERCKRCGEKVFAAEKVPTSSGPYHLGCFSCYCCCKSLCMKSMYAACGEIYCKQCYNNYFGVSGYRYCC